GGVHGREQRVVVDDHERGAVVGDRREEPRAADDTAFELLAGQVDRQEAADGLRRKRAAGEDGDGTGLEARVGRREAEAWVDQRPERAVEVEAKNVLDGS